MNARRIAQLRNEIAQLRAQIAAGQDYDGSLTQQATRLLDELDTLTA